MADSTKMGLTYILFGFYLSNFVTSFNVDTKDPYIYADPKGRNTYFGYSIAFNKVLGSIVVGAPLSNDTNMPGIHQWGTVYTCKYAATNVKRNCIKLNRLDTRPLAAEMKHNQMMGATVYSDNYKTMGCAPRYKTKSSGKIWIQGKCEIIQPFNDDDDYIWQPCVQLSARLQEFGNCEMGLSVKYYGKSGDAGILSGMPVAQMNKGILAVRADSMNKFSANEKLDIADYMGYAVATGKFIKDGEITIIGGAPRANLLTGAVLLYQIKTETFEFLTSLTNPDDNPGSYFGSSLAATDIDNDKLTDLVVGAPYYSSGVSPNEGAVYVFMNTGKGGSSTLTITQKIYGKKEKNSCFGYSIGSVGDLNKDANNDVVIGAPWGGKDGRGVVYVYYGAPSDVEPLLLKQTIDASVFDATTKLDGFGYSFAEYYPYKPVIDDDTNLNDVDNNYYPDLAIGAYRSDAVVILRSHPVVTIIGKVKNIGVTKKIDLYNTKNMCLAADGKKYKCVKLKVSFQLTGAVSKDGTDIKYSLNMDSEQIVSKRGFFLLNKGDKKKYVHHDVMKVKSATNESKVFTVYLLNNTKDIVRPMDVMVKWNIDNSKGCPGNKICPVTNQMLGNSDQITIPYIKGCSSDGNDDCNTDLVVSISKSIPGGGDTIQSGITKVVIIHVKIVNKKENAFLNKLQIIYPNQVQPNKVQIENYPGTVIWDPNVSLDANKNTLEVTLSNPIKENSVEKVKVYFGVNIKTVANNVKSKEMPKIKFEATALTKSVEMKPADNKASISIAVALVANLTVTGNVLPEQQVWTKDVKDERRRGPTITHTFLFQNRGPSGVETSDVLIKFPEKINGRYILNIIKLEWEGNSYDGHIEKCDVGRYNPVGINDTDINPAFSIRTNGTRLRKRRSVEELLNCQDSPSVTCRTIKCKLTLLKKSEYAQIKIHSTLVEATFEKYIKRDAKITTHAYIKSKVVDKPAYPAKDYVEVTLWVISPWLTKKGSHKPIGWWIIIVCVLVAAILIGLVIFVLYKKKFFQRKRPDYTTEEESSKGDIDESPTRGEAAMEVGERTPVKSSLQ